MYYVKKGTHLNRKKLRLGILGDTNVGKTSILNSFLNIEFNQDMIATIGIDKNETKLKLNNGSDIKLILWDTAGGERYRSIALSVIKSSHGGIIVFDVTSRKSFENVSMWLDSIYEIKENFDLILFGNKADKDKSEWKVTNEEIIKFIEGKKLKYFEVSAKNLIGINEGINYIANELCKEEEKEYIVILPRKK